MFEYEKTIIGYLIRYYRTKNKILAQDFFSYKSEIMDEYCVDCKKQCKNRQAISSHKTLERIERGIPAKRDCCYVDFAYKLGFTYEMSLSDVKKIDAFEKELIRLICSKKSEDFIKFRRTIKNVREKMEGKIYFQEILDMYIAFSTLEIENLYWDKELLEKMEYLFNYVRLSTKKVILYYLFRYYSRFNKRDISSKSVKIAEEIYPENIQMHLSRKNLELNELDFLNYLQKMEGFNFKGADLYFFYQFYALAYLNLRKNEKALEYTEKCIEFAEKNDMVDHYIYQAYMRKGIMLYQLGRYDEAKESFKKVYYNNINLLVSNLIFFLHCYEIIGHEDEIPSLLTDSQFKKINNDMIKAFFVYYRMKYNDNFSLEELEDYIIENLKPHLRRGIWYEEIIRNDLIKYTEITRNYKKIYLYMKEDKKKKIKNQ